jgi:hypothetical protein
MRLPPMPPKGNLDDATNTIRQSLRHGTLHGGPRDSASGLSVTSFKLPLAQNPVEMSWHGRLAIGTAAPGRDASRLGGVCCCQCAGRVLVDSDEQLFKLSLMALARESRRGRSWGRGARGPHCAVLLGMIVLRTGTRNPPGSRGRLGDCPLSGASSSCGLPWAESTDRRELMTRTLSGSRRDWVRPPFFPCVIFDGY